MDKVLGEIENFFRQYKGLYGTGVYLDGEISTPEAPIEHRPPVRKNVVSRPMVGKPALKQRSAELQAFFEEINKCQKCALGKTRKNFVFGYGHPHAKVMLIGEAPGREEDETGIPFVGPAGKLLDKMLQAIGISREEVFIANVLKCRPPKNRDPLPDEVIQCEPYLKKQLELVKPRILVSLGRISGQTLLRNTLPLNELRKQTHKYNGIPLLVTYHPSALLRNPRWKKSSWQDLKKLREMLKDM